MNDELLPSGWQSTDYRRQSLRFFARIKRGILRKPPAAIHLRLWRAICSARGVHILLVLTASWAMCGASAFVIHFVRCAEFDFLETLLHLVVAMLLGPIALIGILTDGDLRK